MVDFEQNVTIDIEVEGITQLSKIAKSAKELDDTEDALEDFDQKVQNVDSALDSLGDGLEDDPFEGFRGDAKDAEDPLANFRGAIRRTQVELSDMDEALSQEREIETDVDQEGFLENVEEDLNEVLRKQDLTASVALDGEVDTDAKSAVMADLSEVVDDIEDEAPKITPVLDDEIQSKRGRINTATLARKVGEDLEGVRQSDRVEITPRIAGEVKWSTDSAGGSKAMASYNARITALQNRPGMKKLKPEIKGDVEFEGFEDLELPDNISEDIDQANELAETLERVSEQKEQVSEDNDKLSNKNEQTVVSTEDEANAFHELIDAGSDLADVKKAASESNQMLNDANKETSESALKETEAFGRLWDDTTDLAEVLDELNVLQDDLAETSEETGESIDMETRSISQLAEQMDGDRGLAGAKEAASKANRKLGEDAETTSDSLQREFGISEKNADAISGVKEEHDSASRASRSLRNSLDETTDSMRAANKVSSLFEDGLGSMSVNLGAFTLALRNFLTQVPLLLAGLGSLGAAATGVASSFIAAGTAIGAAIGAGALANAQALDEQYSQIEGTGEALQVMMEDMKDLFLEAVQPLTENNKVIDIFAQTVEGLAQNISLVTDTLNELMTIDAGELNVLGPLSEGSDEAAEDVMGITGLVDELGERLQEPFEELNRAMSFAFLNLQDEFLDMSAGVVSALSDMVRFSTRFTDGITESTGAMTKFTDALAEMAELGGTMFAGLLPVFGAFATIIEGVASVVNSMNAEFVAAAITFVAIIAALNRMGGFFSSIIGVIPNFIVSVQSANGSILQLSKSFVGFMKESRVLGAGFVDLAESIEDLGSEFRLLQLQTEVGEESFESLEGALLDNTLTAFETAESMEELKDDLIESALAADKSEREMAEFARELREVGISAEFADDQLDEMARTRSAKARRAKMGGGAAAGAIAGSEVERSSNVLGKLRGKLDEAIAGVTNLLTGSTSLSSVMSSLGVSLSKAASSLSSFLGPLVVIVALVGGVLVGLIANLDEIMNILSVTAKVLGELLSWLATEILDFFIATWNALLNVMIGLFEIVRPIIEAFQMLGIGAGEAGGAIDAVAGTLEFLMDVIIVVIDLTGTWLRILGLILGMLVRVVTVGLVGFIQMISALIDWLGRGLASLNLWGDATDGLIDDIGGLTDAFIQFLTAVANFPNVIQTAFNDGIQSAQDRANDFIEVVNDFVEKANDAGLGIELEKIDKIEAGVGGSEGAQVSREELAEDTAGLFSGLEGEKDKQITYNEDNSTNIEQTVDADPEDQAQLSRVVTDAVAEANSFERRRQGGQ